jgi:hypothetical protein
VLELDRVPLRVHDIPWRRHEAVDDLENESEAADHLLRDLPCASSSYPESRCEQSIPQDCLFPESLSKYDADADG